MPKRQSVRVRKTSKGALVKDMTKRLPGAPLEHPLIEPKLRQIMKGYSGIYVLYHGAQIYCVGLTSDPPVIGSRVLDKPPCA